MESTREGDTTGAPMAECVAVFVMFDPEAAKAVPLPDAVCVRFFKKNKLYTHSRGIRTDTSAFSCAVLFF